MQKEKVQISTVDEYIAMQPEPQQTALKKLRELVKKAAPKAEEVISYGMPAYKLHGMLLYYAAYKNHYGFYAMPGAIASFKDKLKDYKLSKGTIQFPVDKSLPTKLITDIVKFRIQENLEKEALKNAAKAKKTKK
ncbi:MAG: DUF1801 domain-containing protein [Bacteroidota bacterium]|nr:DUF1801 domain-containing protein [Bacteroidota bacterium]